MEDHSFSESSAPESAQVHTHDTNRRREKGQRKKFPLKIVIFALVVILLGFVGWFVLTPPPGASDSNEVSVVTEESTTVITDTPTPTPEPVDKTQITFEILNGTGIPKEASFLVDEITKLGYEQFDTGNADDDTYKDTIVTYNSGTSETVKQEITQLLKSLYETVTEKTGSIDTDVQIITGYKKGHTPTPTSAPAATKTPTPTQGSASATGTVTPTVTETPTPTP